MTLTEKAKQIYSNLLETGCSNDEVHTIGELLMVESSMGESYHNVAESP